MNRALRLWREKRGEVAPEDLSRNLVVQLGSITENLNRAWYEWNSGHTVLDVQRRVHHPVHKWMAATLDGRVQPTGAVFEAKFMLPWSFSEEAAGRKTHQPASAQYVGSGIALAVLSIITGGGKWVEIEVHADPLYQHLLLTAQRKFWRCVQTGDPPTLFGVRSPRPRRAGSSQGCRHRRPPISGPTLPLPISEPGRHMEITRLPRRSSKARP